MPQSISNIKIRPNPNKTVPLSAMVSFESDCPVAITLTISDGSNQWTLDYDMDRNPADGLPILGMRADRVHTISISTEEIGGARVDLSDPLPFVTPPLPKDPSIFPPMQVNASQPARMEPGYTMIMARRRIPGEPTKLTPEQRRFMTQFGWGILVDATGEVVWYFQTEARVADVIQLRNGNLLYLTTEFRMTEIDMMGNEIRSWYAQDRPQGPDETAIPVQAQTLHHCVYELSNGNFMAFTANAKEVESYYTSEWDPNAPRKTQMVMGDTIIEFTRAGEIVWRWNCFDHLDPYRIGYETLYSYWWVRGFPGHADWTHGNSMWIDEADDTILICLRYQEAIFKIDRKTGEILWILGEHTDWPPKLQTKLLAPVGAIRWPYHAHTPSITGDGKFLIFDNALFQARPFTAPKAPAETYGRAAEYAIDEEKMTVQATWASDTFGPDNVISYAMGDADWLPQTGNVLVSYGMCVTRAQVQDVPYNEQNRCSHVRAHTRIREVTRTDPPEVIFEITLRNDADEPDVGWVCFGAERIKGFGSLQLS